MYFIERERFPFVHLLPRWLQKLVWNRLKPEAWKFIPVSHFGSRGVQAIGASSIAFQDPLTRIWIGSRAARK